MLQNFIAAKILENLEFQPTPGQVEMIAELGLAKTLETTFEEIHKTIHAHPTMSEAIMEAAADAENSAIHI